jgi:FKBP-type peptidyl-prolyl cis-trans isomerase
MLISAAADEPAPLVSSDGKVGAGAEAVNGKKLTVHYVGTLESGKRFDASRDRGKPFTFTLGDGTVIAGWDQGMAGMKEGGLRRLVVPPQLAYGPRAVGNTIPPNSTLIFEIELLKVE